VINASPVILVSSTQGSMAGLPTPESSASFWHSEPSDFLLGHRTSNNLPREADVVIVGSGITGVSAARFLIEDGRSKGLSVVMLEAREACWGATGRVYHSDLFVDKEVITSLSLETYFSILL